MWLIDFLSSLPLWLLAVLLNVWLMGSGLIGLWAVRKWVLPRLRLGYDDAYYAAAVGQSAMMLYGLVAALTAVGVWQKYSQASDTASAEATAIASLWRDLGGYPPPVRDATRDVLRGYTEQIIERAWPEQREGRIPSEGVEWMDRLQHELFAYEPTTEAQKAIHADTLQRFHQLVQERRHRLDSVQAGLPSVLWYLLLPGALGCIVLFLFFHLKNVHFQAGLLLGLSGFLAMVLFIIIALDRPFRGDMGIGPESYQLIYNQYMKNVACGTPTDCDPSA